jgi:hypothetical protein
MTREWRGELMRKLYGYAYDGGGVELRCDVEVLNEDTGHELALVRFPVFEPPLDARSEIDLGGGVRAVPKSRFSEVGTYARLASFNFLD